VRRPIAPAEVILLYYTLILSIYIIHMHGARVPRPEISRAVSLLTRRLDRGLFRVRLSVKVKERDTDLRGTAD
jgi:hypothetical protein